MGLLPEQELLLEFNGWKHGWSNDNGTLWTRGEWGVVCRKTDNCWFVACLKLRRQVFAFANAGPVEDAGSLHAAFSVLCKMPTVANVGSVLDFDLARCQSPLTVESGLTKDGKEFKLYYDGSQLFPFLYCCGTVWNVFSDLQMTDIQARRDQTDTATLNLTHHPTAGQFEGESRRNLCDAIGRLKSRWLITQSIAQ